MFHATRGKRELPETSPRIWREIDDTGAKAGDVLTAKGAATQVVAVSEVISIGGS